jgi:hypothetical protein
MPKDTSKGQADSGGDKDRNQPEKGNKVGANDKDHRHEGGRHGNDRRR